MFESDFIEVVSLAKRGSNYSSSVCEYMKTIQKKILVPEAQLYKHDPTSFTPGIFRLNANNCTSETSSLALFVYNSNTNVIVAYLVQSTSKCFKLHAAISSVCYFSCHLLIIANNSYIYVYITKYIRIHFPLCKNTS